MADTHYETDPLAIERESFRQIRALVQLDDFDRVQQQVVMRIIHSMGLPDVASAVRFSADACRAGMRALQQECTILCDVDMVRAGITRRFRNTPPLCYLNDASVLELAKSRNETRTMAAVDLWKPQLSGSIVLIGNAPTALYRLLEIFEKDHTRPELVIAMPVGFVGAAESKQLLWDRHCTLGIECITLLGRLGGSAVTSASCNALLRCVNDEWY